MQKRGQASVEFLIVVAFGLMIVTGVIYALSSQLNHQTEDVDMAQINKFGNSIVETISRLSYMGGASSLTIKQVLPAGVVNITMDRTAAAVNNRTFIIWYEGINGISPVTFFSPIDMAIDFSNFNRGTKTLFITTKNDYALVCNVEDSYSCNGICDYDHLESAATDPSDCCKADCTGCSENKKYYLCGTDSQCHPECYGHNGCETIC